MQQELPSRPSSPSRQQQQKPSQPGSPTKQQEKPSQPGSPVKQQQQQQQMMPPADQASGREPAASQGSDQASEQATGLRAAASAGAVAALHPLAQGSDLLQAQPQAGTDAGQLHEASLGHLPEMDSALERELLERTYAGSAQKKLPVAPLAGQAMAGRASAADAQIPLRQADSGEAGSAAELAQRASTGSSTGQVSSAGQGVPVSFRFLAVDSDCILYQCMPGCLILVEACM